MASWNANPRATNSHHDEYNLEVISVYGTYSTSVPIDIATNAIRKMQELNALSLPATTSCIADALGQSSGELS
jgi:hypothetical protein